MNILVQLTIWRLNATSPLRSQDHIEENMDSYERNNWTSNMIVPIDCWALSLHTPQRFSLESQYVAQAISLHAQLSYATYFLCK